MITTFALLLGFFIILLIVKMKNNKPKIRSKINFKTQKGKTYTGVLRQGTSGRTRSDWDFYDDESDDLILDLIILDYLFDVIDFEDDWDETDYAIEDGFMAENMSNTEVAEEVVYSDVVEEVPVEAVIEEAEPDIDGVIEEVAEPIEEYSEPVYIPEPVAEVHTPEPVAEVYEAPEPTRDVYETSNESSSYESSYESSDSSSDSGGSDD